MKLFSILRKKNVKKIQWTVIFRTRHMEVKSLKLMAINETEILSVINDILPSGTEYIGCTQG